MNHPTSKKYPVKIGGIVDRLINKWASQSKQQEGVWNKLWRDAVGEKIAIHSSPLRLSNRKLVVVVETAAWMNELTYLKENIKIQTKNLFLDSGIVVEDIVFKLGHIKKNPEPPTNVPPFGK